MFYLPGQSQTNYIVNYIFILQKIQFVKPVNSLPKSHITLPPSLLWAVAAFYKRIERAVFLVLPVIFYCVKNVNNPAQEKAEPAERHFVIIDSSL